MTPTPDYGFRTCDQVLAQLQTLVDGQGELLADCEELKAHLEACEPCLRERDAWTSVRDAVRTACAEQAGQQLRARISDVLASALAQPGCHDEPNTQD